MGGSSKSVNLNEIPAPIQIEKPAPEKIVQDILLSTLARLKQGGNAEIAEAAERFAALIEAEAL